MLKGTGGEGGVEESRRLSTAEDGEMAEGGEACRCRDVLLPLRPDELLVARRMTWPSKVSDLESFVGFGEVLDEGP